MASNISAITLVGNVSSTQVIYHCIVQKRRKRKEKKPPSLSVKAEEEMSSHCILISLVVHRCRQFILKMNNAFSWKRYWRYCYKKHITEGFKIVSGNYEWESDSAKLFPFLELHLYGKSDCMNKFGRTWRVEVVGVLFAIIPSLLSACNTIFFSNIRANLASYNLT
jgi:hypothetical protein